MNREQSALWQRIESFEIDDPASSFPFSARLARENGWTHEFALRVVEEYKRFVFLLMVAGHEVTPSDEVDQAWHLHLVYTHSYWDELCGQVLGRQLHHGPTNGGHAEGERFEDQYVKTLVSYERCFGATPPGDIWPPCEVRFARDNNFVRVNAARYWIVGKRMLLGAVGTAMAASLALLLTGAANPARLNDPFADSAGVVAAVGLLIVVAIVLIAFLNRNHKRRGGGSIGCGTGFFGCSGDVGHHDGGSGCGASGCGASGCGGSGCGGGGCGGGGCGGGGD